MGPRPLSRPKPKGGKSGQKLKPFNRNSIRRGPKSATKAKLGSVGWRIQKLRKLHDLTQTEFARQVGVGQGAVSAWETGKVEGDKIPDHTLRVIGQVLDVSETYLRTGREAHPRVAEGEGRAFKLPSLAKGVEVLRMAREGLEAEALSLARAQKALREAVKAGKPVWLVVG